MSILKSVVLYGLVLMASGFICKDEPISVKVVRTPVKEQVWQSEIDSLLKSIYKVRNDIDKIENDTDKALLKTKVNKLIPIANDCFYDADYEGKFTAARMGNEKDIF